MSIKLEAKKLICDKMSIIHCYDCEFLAAIAVYILSVFETWKFVYALCVCYLIVSSPTFEAAFVYFLEISLQTGIRYGRVLLYTR